MLQFILLLILPAQANAPTIPLIQVTLPEYIEQEYKKAADEFKVDQKLFGAVVAIESGFCREMINAKSKDYGCAQINHKTASFFRFDEKLLKTNIRYSLRAGAKVFKYYNSNVCKYHLGPNPSRRPDLCLIYKAKIKVATRNLNVEHYWKKDKRRSLLLTIYSK